MGVDVISLRICFWLPRCDRRCWHVGFWRFSEHPTLFKTTKKRRHNNLIQRTKIRQISKKIKLQPRMYPFQTFRAISHSFDHDYQQVIGPDWRKCNHMFMNKCVCDKTQSDKKWNVRSCLLVTHTSYWAEIAAVRFILLSIWWQPNRVTCHLPLPKQNACIASK